MLISIELPFAEVERERLRWEKSRARRLRYEQAHGRTRHDAKDTRVRHDVNDERARTRYEDYGFIGWDGEATTDTGYSLFMSSEGHEIMHPRLETEECLDLLIEAKREHPASIFVWFGGRYDWDEILRQSVPMRTLARLKLSGSAHWHGFRLSECEGKFYEIRKDGITVVLYEIHGWFHSRYTIALERYGIATSAQLELLTSEKNRRNEFLWSEIKEIREYCKLELALMPPLMDRIRVICHDAGFRPRAWYGPSALAKELLTKNKIKNHMAVCPEEVNDAACHAFAGGRFELFRGGILPSPKIYDRNSAYMYAALDLPSLAHGNWRHTRGTFEPGKFALYHIRYHAKDINPLTPRPLFRRLRNGNVCWPRRVEGWYWSPEAELVADDPDARFLEAWVFDEETSERPFNFVKELYRKRLVLQSLPDDNPSREAEQAFKWALAAIFGQLCRIVGWDKKNRKPPSCHQIEWAGYILSHCRAAMHREAVRCGENLASIDTDSVTCMNGFTLSLDLGKHLGQWKEESATSAVIYQNGVYFTRTQDAGWSKGKVRGMERRKTPDLTPDMLIDAIRSGQSIKLTPKRKYTTVRMALNGSTDKAGVWAELPGNVLRFGGGGKRYHNEKFCGRYCDVERDIHCFLPSLQNPDNPFDIKSYPRLLPWKQKAPAEDKPFLEMLWADTETFDDELWLAELVCHD